MPSKYHKSATFTRPHQTPRPYWGSHNFDTTLSFGAAHLRHSNPCTARRESGQNRPATAISILLVLLSAALDVAVTGAAFGRIRRLERRVWRIHTGADLSERVEGWGCVAPAITSSTVEGLRSVPRRWLCHMDLELVYFDDCANWRLARERLGQPWRSWTTTTRMFDFVWSQAPSKQSPHARSAHDPRERARSLSACLERRRSCRLYQHDRRLEGAPSVFALVEALR